MVDQFQARTFVPGDVLLREGDTGDAAYLIESGHVEISKMVDGRRVVLNTLGPGAIVGEMALIDRAPRSATVTAVEQSWAMRLRVQDIDALSEGCRARFRLNVMARRSPETQLGSSSSGRARLSPAASDCRW